MSLVEFLTARLDEREEAAREAVLRPWFSTDNFLDDANGGDVARFEIAADARHAGHHDPARVLADVAAKRRIIELHTGDHECSTYDHNGAVDHCTWVIDDCSTLQLLALPDADHPDYREEWKPVEES